MGAKSAKHTVGRREEGRKQEKEGGLFQGRKDPLFELTVIIIIFFVVRNIIPSRGRNKFCRGWKAVVKRGWCTPSDAYGIQTPDGCQQTEQVTFPFDEVWRLTC